MKHFYIVGLIVGLFAVLAGCGGGGGAVSMEPSPTNDSVTTELMNQIKMAQMEITEIPKNEQAKYETQIASLGQGLQGASVAEIMAQLEAIQRIRRKIKLLLATVQCHAKSQILVDGSCQNCPSAMPKINTATNECEALSPSPPDNTEPPPDNMPPTMTTCPGNFPVLTSGECPTTKICPDNSQILFTEQCPVLITGPTRGCRDGSRVPAGTDCPLYKDRAKLFPRVQTPSEDCYSGDNPSLTEQLCQAAIRGNVAIVNTLLATDGIDINRQFRHYDGHTMLSETVLHDGNVAIISMLVVAGADINIPNFYGNTALHIISGREASPVMVSVLLESGANINARDRDGDLPFHLAAVNGNSDIIKMLVARSPNAAAYINSRGRRNSTSLHLATEACRPEAISVLLSLGVDINAKNNRGMTALQIAQERNYLPLISLLQPTESAAPQISAATAIIPLLQSESAAVAPQVSVALAILKNAMPEMPMSVARFILLTTATDWSDEEIDDALNLEAALDMVADMRTPNIAGVDAIPFAALRQELPARYDYLPNRMQGVSVAIQITDDSYYNIGLSDMISAEEKESDIGDGAAEILRPAATDSPSGFFAYGDINSQIGMRYVGNISGVSFMSDIRHTATDTDFVGGDLGVLGAIDGKSNAGEIQFRRYLGDNFAVFGGYEYLDINATVDEGHLISAIDNVRADGYNVGFSFGNLWRFGDQFSLSAKQKTALSDGELTIRYPHAIGNLHAAFYGNRQNIEIRETTISLRQKTPIILTAGYRQPLNAKSEWAAALEYNGKAAAMSLQYKGEF